MVEATAYKTDFIDKLESQGDPGGLEPVLVPQLRQIPLVIYGHSLTVPVDVAGYWHTPGLHWATKLQALNSPLSVNNLGFGGVTMEDLANVITGSTITRWNPGMTKTMAIIMGVLNSAAVEVMGSSVDISVESMKQSAKACMIAMLSDGYSWADTDVSPSTSGIGPTQWQMAASDYGRLSDSYPTVGTLLYATAGGVWMQYVIPPGYTNAPVWIEVTTQWLGVTRSTVQVSKNGTTVGETLLHFDDSDVPHGGKHMLFVGYCSSGDTIRLTKMSGSGLIHHSGFYVGHNRNHVVMICDVEDIISADYPYFEKPEIIAAHNDAIKEAVNEINGIFSDGASLVDLAKDPTYQSIAMQWTGDTLHPNDYGQAWYHARISQKMAAAIPFTPRVHTY